MNANSTLSFSRYANVFTDGLSIDNLRQNVPAVFADAAHESLSQKYTFIPTDRVLTGLISAGFVPVEARQAHSRKGSPTHARHVVRLRRRFETVALRDSVPEVVFLNSHDGTSANFGLGCSVLSARMGSSSPSGRSLRTVSRTGATSSIRS